MGWREFTGRDATERSAAILRDKYPHERGLSRDTMDAGPGTGVLTPPPYRALRLRPATLRSCPTTRNPSC